MPSSRPRVAIAAHRAADDSDASDLYPDPDWPLLSAALVDAGCDATPVSWDDDEVDWRRFDLTVIRSTWDSVDRPQEFLRWARRAAEATTLMNPAAVVAWNIDKRYLRTLQARGVPVVPTEWVVDADSWLPPPQEFVVKPAISAGGRQTARYRPDQVDAATAHVHRLCGLGQTVMVQPYVTSVDADGEAKLVFVDGELSHAVRVGPLFAAGDGVTVRPWEKPVTMDPMRPTPAQLQVADDVPSAVHAEVGRPLLYARVDLVTGPDGQPLLGEVELVDPSLLLRIVPPSAARLAAAITAWSERCAAHR